MRTFEPEKRLKLEAWTCELDIREGFGALTDLE